MSITTTICKSGLGAVLLAASGLMAVPAQAQGYWSYGQNVLAITYNRHINRVLGTEDIGKRKLSSPQPQARSRSSPAPSSSAAGSGNAQTARQAFAFTPSAAVSARMIEEVFSQLPDEPGVLEARRFFESSAYRRDFRNALRSAGLSDANAIDVFAAMLMDAWEIVHDHEPDPRIVPQAATSVANNLALAASANGSVMADLASRGDVGKQELAEIFGVQMNIRASFYNAFRNQRGPNGMPSPVDGVSFEQFQRTVHDEVMQWGMDLSQYDLTAQGFVPIRR